MGRVHTRFLGRKGMFAHLGDSITVSMAFWSSLWGECRNVPDGVKRAYRRVEEHMLLECRSDWKGPEFGNFVDIEYPIARTVVIATDGATLRGAPGRRDALIFDG